MSKTQVRVDIDGAHAVITFFTEEGINILSPNALHSFGAAVARVKKAAVVKTTVVQAKGKIFLAGEDIKVMANHSAEEARQYALLGQDILNDLASLPNSESTPASQ